MDPYEELKGKNALIIGGTGGIGRACVNLFAEHGSSVGFTFLRSTNVASDLVRHWQAKKAAIKAWKVDLGSDASLERFASEVSAHFHHLDTLVMCQGTIEGKRLRDYSFPEMRRVFDVNILSMIKLSKLLHELLAENSAVTFISSISAQAGSYDPVYASSKGAILSFTRAIAKDFGPSIRVNSVAPALTQDTGMFAKMKKEIRERHEAATLLKRLATPTDIANVVLFLSCAASSHITGACIDVNGGEYLR